jgi:alcohol dehydrogenase class IV
VEKLLRSADFPLTLQQYGFSLEEVAGLAEEAFGQWTAGFNPRPVSGQDFAKLYASLFAGTTCAEVEFKASSIQA